MTGSEKAMWKPIKVEVTLWWRDNITTRQHTQAKIMIIKRKKNNPMPGIGHFFFSCCPLWSQRVPLNI